MSPPPPDDKQFREHMARVEALIQEAERFKDARARDVTREMVQALMDLHSAALEKILERLAAAGDTGARVIDALAQDDLIASLLLLYGLHPLDLEARVRQALDKVRPFLHSHGGNVELLAVDDDGTVRLRLQGSCHGCPSSAMTLKTAIEEAIYEKAPDVTALEVEGVVAEGNTTGAAPPEPAAGGNGHGVRVALPILR